MESEMGTGGDKMIKKRYSNFGLAEDRTFPWGIKNVRKEPEVAVRRSIEDIEAGWEDLRAEQIRWQAEKDLDEARINFRREVIDYEERQVTLGQDLDRMMNSLICNRLSPWRF